MGKTREENVKRLLVIWGNHEKLCNEKNERIRDLEQLCSEAGEMRALEISDIPKEKNRQQSFIENSIIRNIDIYEKAIKRLKKEITDILNITVAVDCWLSFLLPDEAELITLRYKDGCTWDYIPDIIHKSRMQCFRIHNKIIKKFSSEDIINLES